MLFDASHCNHRVVYDPIKGIRGAIKTESVLHLANYPKIWTTKSPQFWEFVKDLNDFSETLWQDLIKYLKKYFSTGILLDFLQDRIMVGQKSKGEYRGQRPDDLLDICLGQFKIMMCQRLQNFREEAREQIYQLRRRGFVLGVALPDFTRDDDAQDPPQSMSLSTQSRSPRSRNSDPRHDFGPGILTRCSACGDYTKNRGERATAKVYCIGCFSALSQTPPTTFVGAAPAVPELMLSSGS